MTVLWAAAEVFERAVRLRGFDASGAVVMDVTHHGGLDTALTDLESEGPYAVPVIVSDGTSPPLTVPAGQFGRDHLHVDNGPRFALFHFRPLQQDAPFTVIDRALPLAVGLMERLPKFDGTLIVAGAQTQWMQISGQEIVHVNGFASGRILDGLGVSGAMASDVFLEAVDDILSKPERLALRLASFTGENFAADRIQGALIGAELAAARPLWLGQQIIVSGDATAPLYKAALEQCGAFVGDVDADEMILAGFEHAKTVALATQS